VPPAPLLPTARNAPRRPARAIATPPGQATVDLGSVLSFVDGVTAQERDDVLFSVQLAQRGASGRYDRFSQTRSWYQTYLEILENLGWAMEQVAFTRYDQAEGEFRMDKAALAVIAAIATQNQLAVLQEAVSALDKLAEDDDTLRLFDFHSSLQGSGNFQLGALQKSASGTLTLALGAFLFRSADERRRFLFFRWGVREVNFWTAAHRMTLNQKIYDGLRADVQAKLGDGHRYISDLALGKR
jgi:hypothetical protein